MLCIYGEAKRTVVETQDKSKNASLEGQILEDSETSKATLRSSCAKKNAHFYHILFLIDQLEYMGGAERSLLRMVAYLRNKNIKVTVITLRPEVHPVAQLSLNECLLVIPITKTYSAGGMRAAWHIREIIRSQKVDIVQTFFETSDIWGGLIAKLSGVPVLISSRRDMGIRRSWKHKIAYRVLSRMYDKVVAVSEAVRRNAILVEHLAPPKITTIYSGTVYPMERPLPANQLLPESIPADARVVVSVANLLPWKGHQMFVRVATILHTNFPDVHYVIAGSKTDKSLLKTLEKEIQERGLVTHFHFLGGVDGIEKVLARGCIFCLFSDSEGFPNSIIEAMAAQLPVVATNVGGSNEAVIDGVTGYLIQRDDDIVAAERVAVLLRSENLRREFGMTASKIYQNQFTLEKMMKNWMDLYEDLIERSK